MGPMIATYGARLVPEHLHDKGVSIIMADNTLGISLGRPVMTSDWRQVGLADGVRGPGADRRPDRRALVSPPAPPVKGEKLTKGNSPLAVLKNPALLIILLLTFLSVAAHCGIYTYDLGALGGVDELGGHSNEDDRADAEDQHCQPDPAAEIEKLH